MSQAIVATLSKGAAQRAGAPFQSGRSRSEGVGLSGHFIVAARCGLDRGHRAAQHVTGAPRPRVPHWGGPGVDEAGTRLPLCRPLRRGDLGTRTRVLFGWASRTACTPPPSVPRAPAPSSFTQLRSITPNTRQASRTPTDHCECLLTYVAQLLSLPEYSRPSAPSPLNGYFDAVWLNLVVVVGGLVCHLPFVGCSSMPSAGLRLLSSVPDLGLHPACPVAACLEGPGATMGRIQGRLVGAAAALLVTMDAWLRTLWLVWTAPSIVSSLIFPLPEDLNTVWPWFCSCKLLWQQLLLCTTMSVRRCIVSVFAVWSGF